MIPDRSTTRRPSRVRLAVQSLEARDVPATVIDLTAPGAAGTAGGAILRQADPVSQQGDQFRTFLRLQANGTEQGYNTDHRPFHMNQQGGHGTTHALRLRDVPTVVVNGVTYREFVLDVSQRGSQPFVTLDELQLFVGNSPQLHGYDAGTLGGHAAVFDLDAGGDVAVRLNAALNAGAGKGDALALVPDSLFTGAKYVFLYSRFSGANGGSESWGVRHPGHPSQAGTLSGNVFADMNGDGVREPNGTQSDPTPEPGIAGVTVQAQYTDASGQLVTLTATTDANGDYSFSGLAAGTYTLTVIDPPGYMAGLTSQYVVTVSAGTAGTGYNFGELPILDIG